MVVSIDLDAAKARLTLLTGLILLLICRQEHVIWEGPTRDSSLGSHTMGFACQRSGAGLSIWQNHATLPLDIDRTCTITSG